MAQQTVTFDEVTAAATSLQGDGEQVSIEAVRDFLGTGSPNIIHKYLSMWRTSNAKPAEPPSSEVPAALAAQLSNWAEQYAQDASAGVREALAQAESDLDTLQRAGIQLEIERDQALATVAEHAESIERLTVGLNDARKIATDALVGKAKDQLAIDGKDAQLADLRAQLERNVASSASLSDARLTAEMELVGAATARDNFALELKDLRAQLASVQSERSALRAEVEVLRARG